MAPEKSAANLMAPDVSHPIAPMMALGNTSFELYEGCEGC
jgi:hypothetical protein